jgi:hypothetical protein
MGRAADQGTSCEQFEWASEQIRGGFDMSKRKLIIAYICLVGMPLLGLLGILRAGQQLTPPVSVGGAWSLEANFGALGSGSCTDLLTSVSQPFLSIYQSGANLVFTLNNPQKTALPGTIQGAELTMSRDDAPVSTATGACTNPQSIQLNGTVGNQGGQRVLKGILTIQGCAACQPILFRAVRQSGKGGR